MPIVIHDMELKPFHCPRCGARAGLFHLRSCTSLTPTPAIVTHPEEPPEAHDESTGLRSDPSQ